MGESLLHRALNGKTSVRPPFWFMRQAGRYLPEYRALREKAGSFLTLCYTPEMAAEVTLQPIRRFDMDAAIIFSDILVVPHAMGRALDYIEGEGPKLDAVKTLRDVEALSGNVCEKLQPIAGTLRRVRAELAKDKALIGFCGAPWTVACYMIDGRGGGGFPETKKLMRQSPEIFSLLIQKLVDASAEYLSMQVEAGADTLQVFDSWSGLIAAEEFARWVIEPARMLVQKIKALHPGVPVIGFPRGGGSYLEEYAELTGVNAVGVDTVTPLADAAEKVKKPLQGNLDPELLADDKNAAVAATKKILNAMRGKPFVFNLGHGIVPRTPVENVQAVCDAIRETA